MVLAALCLTGGQYTHSDNKTNGGWRVGGWMLFGSPELALPMSDPVASKLCGSDNSNCVATKALVEKSCP